MGDLLRDDLRGLVPISGSDDQGMDGAFVDSEGPSPLICTIGKDVIGNLTRNLDAHLASGRQSRKVALATSRPLSPRRRENLERRAREKGFTLLQTFDQRGVADRLYHNPRWCRDLLQLAGTPSALSTVPRTYRAMLEIELIGREADVEWLRSTSGDRLISGQPGSGKTYLMQKLVREGWGLFLSSDNSQEIANSTRSQRPGIIVVDDAHDRLHDLEMLRHLRSEIKEDFDIVATTWIGEQDDVAQALGSVPRSRIRRLELLTPKQILQIYRQTGITGSDTAMRILVDQAARKPGLAITLASCCLQGNWAEVREGRALTRFLVTQLKKLVGPETADLLATLGLAGDRGMPLDTASECLGLTLQKGRELALGLAAAGVLSEMGRDLSVWPHDLRWALVARVFFRDSVTHDYREIFKRVPDIDGAILTLLGAAHRGARIPLHGLRKLVEQTRSADVWRAFTTLGAHQAKWALERYSGDMVHLAREALSVAPGTTVPLLLQRAATTKGPLHSQPYHPLRILEDWVRDVRVPPDEVLRRRRALIRLAKKYLQAGGDRSTGVHSLILTLSPKMEGTSPDPANPDGMKYRWGLLPQEQLGELEHLWHRVRDEIRDIDAATWQRLKSVLWGWIHPESVAGSRDIPTDLGQAMRAFAADVLEDLAPMVAGRSGLTSGIKGLAARISLQLPLESDPVFEFLYPEDYPFEDLHLNSAPVQLRELADTWVTERNPGSVARRLALYEAGAKDISAPLWQPRVHELCRLLANLAEHPEQWLQAFLDQGLSGGAVGPFLEKMTPGQSKAHDRLLDRCLQLEDHTTLAVQQILRSSNVATHLLESAIKRTTPESILSLALCNELTLDTIKAFVCCAHSDFALAAAIGEWLAEPRGQVRHDLLRSWETAILNVGKTDHEGLQYFLGEILAEDSALALTWLRRRLGTGDLMSLLQDVLAFRPALKVLSPDQRATLLQDLEETPYLGSLLREVVDRDPDLYGQLLLRRDLSAYHLSPLADVPDTAWTKLALLALETGVDPEEIAVASFARDLLSPEVRVAWGGDEGSIERASTHDRAFAALEDHPSEDLRLVAAHGRRIARARIDALRENVRRKELRGR